jgi:hypothetical protein
VDEAASRRAPGGMALRDRQTGWQGSLGSKAAFLGLARTTQPFASLEGLRARPQFPSKQITNDQDYCGVHGILGSLRHRTIAANRRDDGGGPRDDQTDGVLLEIW